MIDFPCAENCLKKSINVHTKGVPCLIKEAVLNAKLVHLRQLFYCLLKIAESSGRAL